MNKEGRKILETITNRVNDLHRELEGIKDELEGMQQEESDKFDFLSEGLQNAERGQSIEASAEALGNAMDKAQEALDALEQIEEYINEATST